MAEKSHKRKHTGFELPRPTKSYCRVCSGAWSRRKFQRLYKEFDELNKRRTRIVLPGGKKNKVSLNEEQKSWIFRLYLANGELTLLCKCHLKEFARIGDGVYHSLVNLSGQPADYAPPIYDQPDPLAKPKQSKRAPNKKSDQSLAELKKFFKERTHPLPDKAPIRIFFADIPSYRKLYKKYKEDHPKGSPHYFSWACWNYYRRSRFPWVKKQQKTKAACNTCCEFWMVQNRHRKWKGHTADLTTPEAQAAIREYKAKKVLWDVHREHADSEYKAYMSAKEKWGPNTDTLNLSIDAMTQIQLPQFVTCQPKETYFLRNYSVTPMGVLNEATKKGVTYLYGCDYGKTCANHVISVVNTHIVS